MANKISGFSNNLSDLDIKLNPPDFLIEHLNITNKLISEQNDLLQEQLEKSNHKT